MKELIVATTNQGKVKEIQAMLKDLNIEVKSLKDVYDDVPDIVEDGKTFKENALIKAQYVANDLHKIVLADDSGIEIDAFGKLPGIYSARFLGKDTPYPIINQAIIDAIFYFPPCQKTSAEMTLEEKNKYSHRAKALKKLYAILKEL